KAALLDGLVAPERSRGDPLDRFRERLLLFDDHSRDRRGEFGRHRHLAAAVVGEVVEFFDDLLAALVGVHLRALERRRADLAEAVALGDFLDVVDDLTASAHLAGVEVAKALDAVVHTVRWRYRRVHPYGMHHENGSPVVGWPTAIVV